MMVTSFCFTVNFTSNVWSLMSSPDTVTVASYVPAASPAMGVTVNSPVSSTAMEEIVAGTVNDSEFVQLKATLSWQVASYPVLVALTVSSGAV